MSMRERRHIFDALRRVVSSLGYFLFCFQWRNLGFDSNFTTICSELTISTYDWAIYIYIYIASSLQRACRYQYPKESPRWNASQLFLQPLDLSPQINVLVTTQSVTSGNFSWNKSNTCIYFQLPLFYWRISIAVGGLMPLTIFFPIQQQIVCCWHIKRREREYQTWLKRRLTLMLPACCVVADTLVAVLRVTIACIGTLNLGDNSSKDGHMNHAASDLDVDCYDVDTDSGPSFVRDMSHSLKT